MAWIVEEDEGFEDKFYNNGPFTAPEEGGFSSLDLEKIQIAISGNILATPSTQIRKHLSSVSGESGIGSFEDRFLQS